MSVPQGPGFGGGSTRVPFSALVQLLERLTGETGKKKTEKLDIFFKAYGWGDFYPVFRLLLPAQDKERRSYSMKEKVIASYYVDALAIDRASEAAQQLLKFRIPKANHVGSGDFGTAVYVALQDRLPSSSSISIAEVNALLDRLATAADKPARKAVLLELLRRTTALDQKWIVRVILKDLKMGSGERTLLDYLHPDARSLLDTTSNLRKVCMELTDRTKRAADKMVQLFSSIKPMLASAHSPQSALERFGGEAFIIETKFDGNRVQVHRSGSRFAYFSRKGIDGADAYGHILNRALMECIPDADNYILDGELMSWNESEKRFGKFKEVRSFAAASRPGGAGAPDGGRLVLILFDVLMRNNESVMHLELRDRIEILRGMVREKDKVVELVRRSVGRSLQDVEKAVDAAIANREEGIMLKLLNQPYLPNQREGSWVKIKPEYLSGVGDNLDLVVVGAFYGEGTGGRAGTLSHFLLAVQPPVSEGREPGSMWYTCAKVGTGYSLTDLGDLQYRTERFWKTWDRCPPFLELTPTAEKPDVYLDPRECCVVLEIRCTSIEPSDKYRLGHTLRHPRCERRRSDKGIEEATTYEQMQAFIARGGQYASRSYGAAVEGGGGGLAGKRKGKKQKVAGQKPRGGATAVMPAFRPSFLPGEVALVGEVFKGKCFTVFLRPELKKEMDRLIAENQGAMTAFPSVERTFCIVSEESNYQGQLHMAEGKFDIVRASWIRACVDERRIVPFERRFMLFSTPATCERMLEVADVFGDAFTVPVAAPVLRDIFEAMVVPTESKFSLDNCAYLQQKLYPAEPPPWALFEGLVFYVDPRPPLELCECLIKHFHGAQTVKLTPAVTHVIMRPNHEGEFKRFEKELELMEKADGRKRYLVSSDWVHECVEKGERLVEANFAMRIAVRKRDVEKKRKLEELKEKLSRQKDAVRSASLSLSQSSQGAPPAIASLSLLE